MEEDIHEQEIKKASKRNSKSLDRDEIWICSFMERTASSIIS